MRGCKHNQRSKLIKTWLKMMCSEEATGSCIFACPGAWVVNAKAFWGETWGKADWGCWWFHLSVKWKSSHLDSVCGNEAEVLRTDLRKSKWFAGPLWAAPTQGEPGTSEVKRPLDQQEPSWLLPFALVNQLLSGLLISNYSFLPDK